MKILIKNAKIYTMDELNTVCNSMIIENNGIALLGNYKDVKSHISDKDIIWDVEGRTIIPGMTDS